MKYYKVIKDHKSSFPDPIILKKGEKVIIGKGYSEDPDWPDWVECISQEGKKGWIPTRNIKI